LELPLPIELGWSN